jgi:hypothetical protein
MECMLFACFEISSVAEWFATPETQSLLDFVRPDFLLLRVDFFLELSTSVKDCDTSLFKDELSVSRHRHFMTVNASDFIVKL